MKKLSILRLRFPVLLYAQETSLTDLLEGIDDANKYYTIPEYLLWLPPVNNALTTFDWFLIISYVFYILKVIVSCQIFFITH
jgi:hypothetical protein